MGNSREEGLWSRGYTAEGLWSRFVARTGTKGSLVPICATNRDHRSFFWNLVFSIFPPFFFLLTCLHMNFTWFWIWKNFQHEKFLNLNNEFKTIFYVSIKWIWIYFSTFVFQICFKLFSSRCFHTFFFLYRCLDNDFQHETCFNLNENKLRIHRRMIKRFGYIDD